jgi:hypothetical protein
MFRFLAFVTPLIGIAVALGCTSHADNLQKVRSDYFAGNLALANAKLETEIAKKDNESDVWKLDRATVLLTEGKPKEAEKLFREVRDHFDALEGKDAGEITKSMLTDDRQLAYTGEDYEKVLIRFMLAMCNLFGDGSDAAAYALQVNEKQQQIIDKSTSKTPDGKNLKESYKLVGAGAYLHAALKEETHTNYDDVARSLEQVVKWQPDFAPAKADLERAKTGRHSQPGHGVVYVFALVGKGPIKEERAEPVSQVSLLIADRLISAFGKQTLPPTIAPIKVPYVAKPLGNDGKGVMVSVGGKTYPTAKLMDIGEMAHDQCEAVFPETVARAVVRRVVKKGAIYGAKEALKTDKQSPLSLALDITGVAWEATEVADTRCWGLLPSVIQVLRLELPVGEHEITIFNANQTSWNIEIANNALKLNIQDGRNTYVLANYPDTKLAGKILTNSPGK